MLQNVPIRRKLMTANLLTSGAVLLLTCLAFFSYEVLTFRQAAVRQLSTLGKIVAANSTAALAFDDSDAANEILAALKAEPHITAASLYGATGKLFAQYPANSPASAFPAAPGEDGYHFEPGHLSGFQPAMQGGRRLGTLYIEYNMDAMYEQLWRRAEIAALVMVIALLMAYVLSRSLQKQISTPVLALAETASAVSKQRDFSVRAKKFCKDELGSLTDAFNQMLADIQEGESALRKSKAQLQTIVESLDEGIAVSDVNGQLLHFNRAALAMHGFSNMDECRIHLKEFAHRFELSTLDGTVLPVDQWPLARVLRGEILHDFEVRIRSVQSGGWRRVFSYGGTLVRDAAGQTLMAVVTINDITERKLAAQALHQSRDEFKDLFDNAPIGYHEVDASGRLARVNKAELNMLGYSAEELIGQFVWKISAEEETSRIAALAKLRGEPPPAAFERMLRRKDGSVFPVLIEDRIVKREDGSIACIRAIVQDITERKAVEEKIRQLNTDLERRVVERTAELEAANKELEAFSYSVSHDLRAPLRHVDGFVDLLRKQSAEKLDDRGRRYLDVIAASARQMGTLIDDLLVFSRMSRGDLRRSKVASESLVHEVRDALQGEIRGRVVWKVDSLPQVEADAAMLRQVWANLIGNAIKYSRTRDPAEIEIGCTDSGNGEFVFFVRDNGVGFDMKYVDKLFGVFQRLHRSDEFEGTGIGLANVRRIVSRHGGRTWAESKVDGGATFFFSLPKTTN